jgi:hypothetical protein
VGTPNKNVLSTSALARQAQVAPADVNHNKKPAVKFLAPRQITLNTAFMYAI